MYVHSSPFLVSTPGFPVCEAEKDTSPGTGNMHRKANLLIYNPAEGIQIALLYPYFRLRLACFTKTGVYLSAMSAQSQKNKQQK